MWFEGETTLSKFPDRLRTLLTTPDPATGQPMWQFVSSNIGSTINDDGYVFYSQGSSGKDNIYIGYKNAYFTDAANWHLGHRYFATDSYTPGVAGSNGTFGDTIFEGLRCHYNTTTTIPNVTLDPTTFRLRYSISVTKDRVIICIRNLFVGYNIGISGVGTQPLHLRNILYLGLINRYSNEPDSSAIALTSLYPCNTSANVPNNVCLLRNGGKVVGSAYTVLNTNHQPNAGRKAWGRHFIANTIPLATASEGVRGDLDGLLQVKYELEPTGYYRNVPEEGSVTMNGQEYFCVVKPYYHYAIHDSLAPFTTNGPWFAYFIAKV